MKKSSIIIALTSVGIMLTNSLPVPVKASSINEKEITAKKVNKLSGGRDKAFKIPKRMTGTWYAYNSKKQLTTLKLRKNIISTTKKHKTSKSYLYTRKKPFTMKTPFVLKWCAANNINDSYIRKLGWYDAFHTRTWGTMNGAGNIYALHDEKVNGKKTSVLILASGANPWIDRLAYRSKSTAKQLKQKHYTDLPYR